MTFKVGYEYKLELKMKIGIIPFKININMVPDTETTWHGNGSTIGYKASAENGTIDGNKLKFNFELAKLNAYITAELVADNSGNLTGTGICEGYDPFSATGKIVKEVKL